ncbi:hypothetical protein [Atribacter laminatus]|uniref:LPS-assembly protein LptD n=1 Tax=Atribacter laminatus TaxID=2847778 RepID=A0A7T1AKQ0_ATRLM|nr:hypothetical protein [Atribacter laminatus]QPM67679.1 LPS-assembly protein LptD [Atribacter laminatus]
MKQLHLFIIKAMKNLVLFAFFLILFSIALTTNIEAKEGIRINADTLLYDDVGSQVEAVGNVQLSWKNVSFATNQLLFRFDTSEAFVPGFIKARFGDYQISAEKMYYNFQTRNGWFESAELVYELNEGGKLFFRGSKIEYQKGKWAGLDLLVTGCPHSPPLYSVRAKEVLIYPQDRILISGLGFYIKENRIIQLPAYSRLLNNHGGNFIPSLGYQRKRGLFVEGNYEYLFSENLLFQANLYYSTRQSSRISGDITLQYSYIEARIFIDLWQNEKSTFGGYAHYQKNGLSLWMLGIENERFNDEIISRLPQFIASYRTESESGFFIEANLSYGKFSQGDINTWRNDIFLSAGLEKKSFGGEIFYQNINLSTLDDAIAWGGKVWAEKEFSSRFSAGIYYEYTQVNGETYFFFDPKDTNIFGLELVYGDLDQTYLRLRGEYDLNIGSVGDIIAGIGLGSKEFSVGMETIYSFPNQSWEERRYYVRKQLEECIDIEASYWESDQTFFVSVNLAGLDQKKHIESLFEKQEEYDLFNLDREN